MPPFRNRYATIRFAARCGRWLLVTVAFGCAVVWAQSQPAQEQKGISAGLSVEIESELPRAEQDVTLRLEQLEDLQRVQKNLHKAMERDQAALAEAESSGDSSRQRMALESLRWRQEISAALGRRIRTVQLLYDQAVENYRITSERQRLVRESGLRCPECGSPEVKVKSSPKAKPGVPKIRYHVCRDCKAQFKSVDSRKVMAG